ncbi:MAG: hypothetical protein COV67_09040 [Nitrospinae bacterium CG11_big_fil_rev_8_21_14_0_20_56_8]|nr:MAG: hypothetical protein COV67_09040 [Nitrospinae bacterium CG11_big_fil_rev_8_21_14_0_20_56_8]
MSAGFYYPAQAGATTQWVPAKQPAFPNATPVDYPEQLVGESAGGTMYVQDKGVKRERFLLEWDRLTTADRDGALAFFNTVKKAFLTFEYEDPGGTLHTVRWMNGFNFSHVAQGRWSGSIELRKQTD